MTYEKRKKKNHIVAPFVKLPHDTIAVPVVESQTDGASETGGRPQAASFSRFISVFCNIIVSFVDFLEGLPDPLRRK